MYDRKINLLEKKITDLADPNKADSRERKRSHRAVVNSTETISKPRKYSVIVKAAHLEEE